MIFRGEETDVTKTNEIFLINVNQSREQAGFKKKKKKKKKRLLDS